jgi:hypothetical protein
MKTPNTWAALVITGELNPEEITQLLKIEASFSHAPGTISDSKNKGFWQLNSSLDDTEIIENHLWDILKKLAPVRNLIKGIVEKHQVVLYCSVEYSNSGIDSITLGPRILSLIGNLGVSLQISHWKNKKLGPTDISLL